MTPTAAPTNGTALPAKSISNGATYAAPGDARDATTGEAAEAPSAPETASESNVAPASGNDASSSEPSAKAEGAEPSTDPAAEDAAKPDAAKPDDPTTPDAKFSKRFAALTRKERRIAEQERQLKTYSQQVEGAKQVYTAFEQAKSDPRALAKFLGHESFEKFFEQMIEYATAENARGNNPEATKLAALEQRQLQWERDQREAKEREQQQRIDRTIEDSKRQIRQHLETNTDQYELINLHGAHEDVWETIEEYFNRTGQLLVPNDTQASIKKAADLVEDALFQDAQKILRAKKLGRSTPASAAPARDSAGAQGSHSSASTSIKATERAQSPNLTNRVSAPISPDEVTLDRDEAARRSAELIRKQLGWK